MPEGVTSPKHCTSYAAGHTVHWTQALHVANKDEARAASRPGLVVAVVGDRVTVHLDDGKAVELLNHDTPRLLALSPALPFAVRWNEQYALLSIAHSGHVFSVQRAERGPFASCAGKRDDREL